MVPGAHISAAIEILDRVLGGMPIDPALANWGRAHRFAGSADRAAIRDLVFDAWRCRRSFAARGGQDTGRGLMVGRLRHMGQDPALFFTGLGHAPPELTATDTDRQPTLLEAVDCPDWLAPRLQASLGKLFDQNMHMMQRRAPVYLRVNLARITRADAALFLAQDGIDTLPHPLAHSALEVLTKSRKLLMTQAYQDGLIELQDVASQAIVEDMPLQPGQRVLDYCAGGGGKTLALAARARVHIDAHDANPARMRDLPVRAKRAGVTIHIVDNPNTSARYDLVVLDVPCSGSGSWRRDPQGKWSLTEARLRKFMVLQADILNRATRLVAPNGHIAYATCSVLADENAAQIAVFLGQNPEWQQVFCQQLTPVDGGDGFFLSILARKS